MLWDSLKTQQFLSEPKLRSVDYFMTMAVFLSLTILFLEADHDSHLRVV